MGGGREEGRELGGGGNTPTLKKHSTKSRNASVGLQLTKLRQFPPKDLVTITRYGKYRPLY